MGVSYTHASNFGAIYFFGISLLRKILVGYGQLFTPDENKQV